MVSIDGLLPREGMTNQVQLDNFIEKLSAQTGVDGAKVSSWFEAFTRLDQAISWDDWTVVLLDEVSCMGRYDADFPARLKSAWDTLLKHHDRLIVVICGSVSTWIKKNILENTGFAGRFSRDLVVRELPLSQCKAFWGEAAGRIASSEIVDVLSVTGGIPRYLEEINPGLSANENIRDLVKPLHLDGVPVLSAVPYEKRKRSGLGEGKGLQIDLLVQTRKSVYVVEIKRKRHIGESIEAEVAEKVARLRHKRGLSIRTALVYEGELAPVVRGNGYFDAIVSAADLIGL